MAFGGAFVTGMFLFAIGWMTVPRGRHDGFAAALYPVDPGGDLAPWFALFTFALWWLMALGFAGSALLGVLAWILREVTGAGSAESADDGKESP